MIVRPAVPADAGALTDLVFRSKASNGYDAAFMEACRDELRITADRLAQAEYWVADTQGPVGCVAITFVGTTAEVENFFIDPDHQRQGIGRRLWAKTLTRAKEEGCNRLTLDADPNAVAFYSAMGFTTIGEKPSGSIVGRMLPHMELQL